MRYLSTRGHADRKRFCEILLEGLAPDGGLYLPERYPQVDAIALQRLREAFNGGRPGGYAALAFEILSLFIDDIPAADLRALCEKTYTEAVFGTPQIVPLKKLEDGFYLEALSNGPTLAFKDMAMQLLGNLFDHVLAERDQRVTIVGATSGDTGSAAIEACAGRARVDIVILHPDGRTSEVQRRQMTTVLAPNVGNIAVAGSFDDCQDLAKACFNDLAFRDHHRLTAVNSINWARVMAQIVYYTAAAARLGSAERPVSFCVPTGNFGNIYAAYAAKQMGAPIGRLIIATNSNDILARFIESGAQSMAAVEATLSPSMDIQVSSNFERLLFDLFDRDGRALAKAMAAFRATGTMRASAAQLLRARGIFDAGRLDDAGTLRVIAEALRDTGELLDPHTAIGYAVARQKRGDPSLPMVVLGTAHPAKFPDAVEKAVGKRPELPERLADLYKRPERCTVLGNDLQALQQLMDTTPVPR
ncbi:MAG: threonine synthase [Hydrogenophaga sp.]|uniref:threonine synthase n=1 Tax=Hydrogenophaga sp. TaxID=1904254 RepID=UPI0026185823|nr:threonine synthase [Hydrogenophaga sp.]MCW5671872.1 threonine synthase [Hydrogenophaga sp.]